MSLTEAISEVVHHINLATNEELENLKDIIDIEMKERKNQKIINY